MGRAIVVGDPNQSLYRFRGADSHAFERIEEMLNGSNRGVAIKKLPINYRCDQSIITHAQQWVPELEGNSKSIGTVGTLLFQQAVERANNDSKDIEINDGENGKLRTLPLHNKKEVTFAFLCRINVPLVITAYQLIGQGKRVCIIGRTQIGGPLKDIIKSLCGTNSNDPYYTNSITDKAVDGRVVEQGLLSRLNDYYRVQTAKLSDEKYANKLEALQQNIECIEVICEKVQDNKVSSVLDAIDTLFTEEPLPGVISLSTIHRSKGLEWDVVFILRPDLLPHPNAKQPDEIQQEINCQYVAATRARNRLYYITNWPFGNNRRSLTFNAPDENLSVIESKQTPVVHVAQPVTQQTKPSNFHDDGEPF